MGSERESLEQRRWAELKDLFGEIVELPPDDWAAFLARIRDRDAGLAEELQRLLDGHAASLLQLKTGRVERLAAGTALGPYVLSGLIGEGGMGQVYRARDERLGRDVAIKVLPTDVTHDAERRARMEREARAMGLLNHPNVVSVYDIGDYRGSPFIVSELLEGETLRDRIAAAGPRDRMPYGEALHVVASVADALGSAHRRGIVHRDIKPENIFLTGDGRTKVLDFGIAKVTDGESAADHTVAGAVIGTLSYMAPEQLRGEAARPQSDVYACGVVLYELLAGVHPYAGRSQAVLIGAVLHEPPPPLTGVPPAVAALVMRCLEKRPEVRPEDGAALAKTLRALTTVQSSRLSSRRFAAAAALVVLVGAGVSALYFRQPPDGSASESESLVSRSPVSRSDVVLPAPQTTTAAAPDVHKPVTSASAPGIAPVAPPAPPADPPARGGSEPSPQPQAPPAPAVTSPAATPAPPSLNGVWTFTEQIREDVHAIDCGSSGALQVRSSDGVLDATLRLKRDCTDSKRRTTDSTDAAAQVGAGAYADDVVSFVTRVVDEGLTTTCRYAGQVVGSARAAMVGEVSCEVRTEGVTGVLALRGTWRANRTGP
jgi:serine/threonine protein kinase